jgi:hypothetical protein
MSDDLAILEEKIRTELARAGIVLPDDVPFDQFMTDLWASLPASEKEKGELAVRAKSARESFSVRGFHDFYWCVWRREAPPYADEWIRSFMSGKWTILECFRGSTKSTTLSVTFPAFILGHFPYTSVLMVQANDTKANQTSSAIANIIALFTGWKETFPSVVPDESRGWGANGYFIKDLAAEKERGYGAWVEETMRDHLKDPSFVGAGITSADIVGMHPRWLFFDDIHDRQNSTFPKDRENVVETVRQNVIPVITKPGGDKPFFGVACTFWDKSDAYHILLETGMFQHIKTPIFKYQETGDGGPAPDATFEGKPIKLTWPEGFPIESVNLYRTSNDTATFKREYLCDETSDLDKAYRVQGYKSEEIDPQWLAAIGVDPVGVLNAGEGISHFAMLEGVLTPYNSVVIVDGMLEKCGSLQGEEYVVSAQGKYSNFLKANVEGNGAGANFVGMLTRHPGLVVATVTVQEIGRGSKFDRQYKFLEPLARSGALRVSDANTPILRQVRKYFDEFPNFSPSDPLADIGDALVLLAYAFPEIWVNKVVSLPGNGANVHKIPGRTVPDLGAYRFAGVRR